MSRIMKASGKTRMWVAALATAILATMGAVVVPAVAASATDSGACVPSAAWDETVVDKAAWTEVIPAVTHTIHHDAVTHTDYQRYSWTGGPIDGAPSEVPPGPDWQANTTNYEGAGHGTDPINQPFQMDKPGKGNADWFYWTATVVVDHAAYDEVVVDTPEQTVAHPAITHVVHHDAVTCPPTGAWVPKSTLTLTATDCYSGGTNVAGLISDKVNIAPDEEIVSLTFNGSPVGDFGPMVSAAGTYTYSYVIKNTVTGETVTSSEKTVTVDACTVTPPKPANPTVVVKCDHCSDANAANGTATVTVTNTADDTKADATYDVTLNGVTKSITLADGKSGNVNFSGLAPGSYDVTVKGSDDTSATSKVTIDKCGVTPPPITKVDFPPVPKVCAPGYDLPKDTDVFQWSISNELGKEGHVIVTIIAENTTFMDGSKSYDYGKVPLGDCPVSPPNPGGNGGGTTPPSTTPVVTPQAPPVDAVARTPEAPVTGAVGNTGAEGYLWGVLALAGLVVGGVAFGLRRRHA